VDVDRDVLQLVIAGILAAVLACRHEMVLKAEDLEVESWERIRSVFEGLDCFLWHALKRGWFGWLRSFESVFETVFGFGVEGTVYCMLGRLREDILRFLNILL
jgi:hypothetical protein